MKRILTVQDISCVGKCSLTVALPIISAAGVEAGILPTAVLSTHTQFPTFTFCDLTEEIEKISNAFETLDIDFDAIYTGYLGSFEQLSLVSDLFDRNRAEKCAIVIDPVMADNGKLYRGFTPEFAREMAKLCGKADLIMPNLTEASFMLDVPYACTENISRALGIHREGRKRCRFHLACYESVPDKLIELILVICEVCFYLLGLKVHTGGSDRFVCVLDTRF